MIKYLHELSSRYYIRKHIRQFIRAYRRTLSAEQKEYFAQLASARMMTYAPIFMARNITVFLSFDSEIDTQPLINQLWNAGKQIYLPVLDPINPGNLLFLRYHPQSKLIVNHLKIREPELNMNNVLPINQIDTIIIPLTAFDKQGNRLGMGGGFYDRTLQHWQRYRLKIIGYAYDFQIIKILPTEYWDVPLSAVVTPSKLWVW